MLTAAFGLLSQMLPGAATAPAPEAVSQIRQHLTDSAETDEQGRRSLRITLPSDEAITQFAETLARLMGMGSRGE
jgi:hypothetical protein